MRISDWSSDVCSSDLEVDEAANHIRELVDPDANIIWGSAFNDGLDGKIRVSVVATGIDSNGEQAAAAPAARSFSFAPRPAAAVAEEAIGPEVEEVPIADRKSTRLNSSH